MRLDNLNRRILSLAAPAVVATITTPLLSLVDVAFTGHMGSAIFIAAIALGGNVFNLLYWPLGFLRMGTSGLTAQASAKEDRLAVKANLQRSLLSAIFIGLIFILLQRPIEWGFNLFFAADNETWTLSSQYIGILIWGAPAMLSTFALSGWFVGLSRTKAVMWMSIAIDIINLILTGTFVLIFHMKIEGVAIATLMAQWSGFAIGIVTALKMCPELFRIDFKEVLSKTAFKSFLRVNRDIFLRTICLIAVTLWFTRQGSMQGPIILAANTLLMQFFILFSYFVDGIACAAEPLSGYAMAGKGDINKTVRRLIKWGASIALVFTLIYFVAGTWFIDLLSDNVSVKEASREYIAWTLIIPLVSFCAFVYDGVFIGAMKTHEMFMVMAVATISYFVFLWIGYRWLGNHALWLAFSIYLGVRSIGMHLLRPRKDNP